MNKGIDYNGAAEGFGFDNLTGDSGNSDLFGIGGVDIFADGQGDGQGKYDCTGYCDDSNNL